VQGSKVVGVLSALQSEGKSTVSANLAKVLAMEGRKVLIFDADLRRPSMTGVVGSTEGPGLGEVLMGSVEPTEAVQKSRIVGVDVLGAREGTNGAAELAGSPRFYDALRWARERYEVVILDCPPVNQVSESALVARSADAVVMVVREGQTGRGAAAAARKRLAGMGVRPAGVALNCAVPHGSAYGYGYSYYQYYSDAREKGAVR
jgi:capsular exopolysaccharide synthesis family protein